MRLLIGLVLAGCAWGQVDYNQQIKWKPSVTITGGPFFAKGTGAAVNDNAAIQAAINSICATGGIMEIPAPSSYYGIVAGLQIINCQNITVHCASGATIKFQPGTVDTQYNAWPNYGLASIFRIVDSANITIENCFLDGNLPNRTAHAGGESFNSDVLIAGSTNVHVQNNVLKNGMTDGVSAVYDASHLPNTDTWVQGNQIINNRRCNVTGDGTLGYFVLSNKISGAGTVQGTAPEGGICIEPDYETGGLSGQISQNLHIEGNNVSGSAGTYAVYLSGYGTAGCSIANNQIHDNSGFGLDFEAYATSYHNTDCVVSGGAIYNNTTQAGVRAVGRNLDSITGVKIRNNLFCIQAYASDGLLVTGNVCESNLYGGITGNSGAGLGFISLSVQGNIFRDNFSAAGAASGGPGASFQGTAASSSSLLLYDNNLVQGSGSLAYSTGTVSATNGSPTVTGSGTTWTTALAGAVMNINGFLYPVSSCSTATSCTLGINFNQSTMSGLSYNVDYLQQGLVITGACQCYGRGNKGINISANFWTGLQSAYFAATEFNIPLSASYTPSFGLTPGIENDAVPFIQAQSGTGAAIPSASTITVLSDYQHISGVAAIQNIVPPVTLGSADGLGAKCLSFIPDGTVAYNTGTLSGTATMTTLTGVGTTWTSGMVGARITIANVTYPITAFSSTTSITIGIPLATSPSGASYSIQFPAWTTVTGGASGTQIITAGQAWVGTPVGACYDAGTAAWLMHF